jgi:hypothetical protein
MVKREDKINLTRNVKCIFIVFLLLLTFFSVIFSSITMSFNLADLGDGSNLTANTGGPYNGVVNTPVQFFGSASGGTPPYQYYWTFGDNSRASLAENPTHTYTTAGSYTVTLTVTDNSIKHNNSNNR